MFSKEIEMKTIKELHEQLELAENFRLNKFTGDYIEMKSNVPQLRHEFLKDMNLLTNEMISLDIKAKNVVQVQEWKNSIPANMKGVTNDFYCQMRDLDGQKFKNYIEIFASIDGVNYELVDRSQITYLIEPKIMIIPPGTRQIKIVHGRYGYTLPHPTIEHSLKRLNDSNNIIPQAEINIPRSEIWAIYRKRYGTAYPSHARSISLSQVRDLIYIVYTEQMRLRLSAQTSTPQVENLQNMLMKTLDTFYSLPEVVMKVTFELLTAIDDFQKQHFVRIRSI
jgi:hypothetical protein